MKFKRTYQMTIQTGDGDALSINQNDNVQTDGEVTFANRPGTQRIGGNAVIVSYPLTLDLEIRRNTLASANTAHFKIYNLKQDTRRKVLHDRYDTLTYRQIILNAGYELEPRLPVIFQGNIIYAYSYRQKQDWVTEIEAFDGGFGRINGQVSSTVPAGYDIRSVIADVVRSIPKVALGSVGDVGVEQNSRGLVIMGNSWDVINQQIAPDANAFIDNEKAYVIGKNEYLESPNEPFVISPETGLLETPRRYNALLQVPILFEPRMRVGMLVEIRSAETYYNGQYVVIGVDHVGQISGAVGGRLITTISVWKGTDRLVGVAA